MLYAVLAAIDWWLMARVARGDLDPTPGDDRGPEDEGPDDGTDDDDDETGAPKTPALSY